MLESGVFFCILSTHYSCSASLDRVLSELEVRFSGKDKKIFCALGDICRRETPDEGCLPQIAKFYEIEGEILEAEQKM